MSLLEKLRPVQLCPKCDGQGHVSKPPWVPGDQDGWMSTSTTSYPCLLCGGTGVYTAGREGEMYTPRIRFLRALVAVLVSPVQIRPITVIAFVATVAAVQLTIGRVVVFTVGAVAGLWLAGHGYVRRGDWGFVMAGLCVLAAVGAWWAWLA